MDNPQSHVMALLPLIANHCGSKGNLWRQRGEWLQIVDGLFHDNFDSSRELRNSPPAWILRSLQGPAGSGLGQVLDAYLPGRVAGPAPTNKGEKKSHGPRALRDPPHPASPAPAPATAAPAPTAADIVVSSTKHPLFALSPNLLAILETSPSTIHENPECKDFDIPG
jgi:hypothetical protein